MAPTSAKLRNVLFLYFYFLNVALGHIVVDTFGSKFFQLPGCLTDKARPALNTNKFRVLSDLECARKCLRSFEDSCRWVNYIEPEAVAGENCELGLAPPTATCADLVSRTGYHYFEKNEFCLNGGTFNKGSLQCTCVPGWTGQRCNLRAYDCSDHYYAHLLKYMQYNLDVKPRHSTTAYKVRCDLSYRGMSPAGFTCIQRQGRINPALNFDKTWSEYRDGFGNLDNDFWLGNEILHQITMMNSPRKYRLLVTLLGHNLNFTITTSYDDFTVDSEAEKYRATLTPSVFNSGKWHGDALMPGQPDLDMNNKEFSTSDNDNDGNLTENCALSRKAGWWYGPGCTDANLNAKFYNATSWKSHLWPQLSWGSFTNMSEGFGLVSMCLQSYDYDYQNHVLVVY